MSYWQTAFQKLNIRDEAEARNFHEALQMLEKEERYQLLLFPDTLRELYPLFQKLGAKQTLFSLAMQQSQANILVNFFHGFFERGLSLPEGTVAQRILVRLCNLDLSEDHLTQLLSSGLLDFLSTEKLQLLETAYLTNARTLIEFFGQYREEISEAELQLGFDILLLIYPSMLDEQSAENLAIFIQEMLPYFVERFAHRMDRPTLYSHTDRMVEWWVLWKRHRFKEEDLADDDPYYEIEFPLIIRYVTEFIWWNNGLTYRNGDKNYHFGSPEFRHLATGGSIRKGPDFRTYTRRMARTFATLPYNFPSGFRDMYLYFYGDSLGAGLQLSALMQEYVRHHQNPVELNRELEQWNPIIQKLADPEFEALDAARARELLGFLYHCLRDKPGFSVRGRSIANLCQESDAYMERIRERARRRQEREEARRAQEEARQAHYRNRRGKSMENPTVSWPPHSRIKPMELKPGKLPNHYKIIELLNKTQLAQEGSVMKHCVGSYSHRCFSGECSIWSLRQLRKSNWYSLVTIEVVNNRIIQASAAFNAVPIAEHQGIIKRWAEREKIRYQ